MIFLVLQAFWECLNIEWYFGNSIYPHRQQHDQSVQILSILMIFVNKGYTV